MDLYVYQDNDPDLYRYSYKDRDAYLYRHADGYIYKHLYKYNYRDINIVRHIYSNGYTYHISDKQHDADFFADPELYDEHKNLQFSRGTGKTGGVDRRVQPDS
jgi:hypothetical protein